MWSGIGDKLVRIVARYHGLFLEGIGMTLLLSAITVLLGVVLGSFIALLKMSKFRPVSWLATIYIEIIRGTPLLLQLYFFYFVVPEALKFIEFNKFTSVAAALALNSAAYIAEIIRGGIQSVDRGQTEAARSLGLTSRQTMWEIVFPQAVKNILPSLCNEFVMVIKETSLASTFFVGDLMTQFKTIQGITYLSFEPLIVVGAIYFVMTFLLSKLVAAYERRLKASD
ncbi:MAG: amino acid ABC transporter permease [Clostridiales bacterium]|jgi:His/Glu/Gln/Arg/opine family amino acid ABC transporter permease subunit|nr:amino acid ABC transporter permease [Clostridiales bacterium]